MRAKRWSALLLSGVMAASMLTGCGMNKNETVATFDETEVPLGVANFAARFLQATYDDFYVAYFGEDVWSSDLYNNGTTMQDNIKDSVMQSLFDMYTLEAHMAEYDVELTEDDKAEIADTAAAFIADNSKDALNALGADEEIVERYLTLATIQNRMHTAIIADADTNVTDEEANTSSYSYVKVSKQSHTDEDGNTVEYTDTELTLLGKTVGMFDTDAKAGTLEDAAEQYDYTVSSGTFTADDSNLDETVLTALQGLDEGEVSDVIDTDTDYYVVRLDEKTDADATETTRQNIISQRQSDLYDETLKGWEDEHDMYVKRDIVTVYKQTILGPLWFLIQPIFTTVMYMFIFGGLAGISTDGVPQPLFYMAGIMLWNYFSSAFNVSSNVFTANAGVFGKVYFPRLVVPLSGITSNLIKFGIQLLLFIAMYLYFYVKGASLHVNAALLLFPFLTFLIAFHAMSWGLIVSALTTKYRDLTQLVTFGLQLFMYATPVIYPLNAAPEKYRDIIALNPLTPIFETFKYSCMGCGSLDWGGLAYSTLFMLSTLFCSVVIFSRVERNFMDTV